MDLKIHFHLYLAPFFHELIKKLEQIFTSLVFGVPVGEFFQ